jgi:cystathionine beta-synthase
MTSLYEFPYIEILAKILGFNPFFSNAEIKTSLVREVMEKAYPEVAFDTPVERLSAFINKENGAVLSKDETGSYHIVTKYDIIQSLTK